MEKRVSNYVKVFCAAGVAVLMSACQTKDLYDEGMVQAKNCVEQEAKVKDTKLQYASLFQVKYGDVNPNQSWDFSSNARTLAHTTRAAAPTVKTEKVRGLVFHSRSNKVTRNVDLYKAIENALPDKQSHVGESVILAAPANAFYVLPVSTRCKETHKLVVQPSRMNGITVYEKTWWKDDIHYVNGMNCGNTHVEMNGLKVEAPVGMPIEIFVAGVGGSRSSTFGTFNGHAVYLDMPADLKVELPEGVDVGDNPVVKYIGIDADKDNDYNDAVVMLVGAPDVPQDVVVKNNEYVVNTCISKRYMIKDLGCTDDFDFNDVVVDVTKTFAEHHKVTYEDGMVKKDVITHTEDSTKAVVRALGGTIDFTLRIGNTNWSKSEAGLITTTMYNTYAGNIDANATLAEFRVSGWEPTQNNISVTVKGRNSQGTYEIGFPKVGEVPMIMAFDCDRLWSNERVSIPSSWFTVR